MTAKLNLALREGATFRKRLSWLDGKRRPVNLTGATVSAQMRDGDGAVLMNLTTQNGRLIVAATKGQIDIFLPAADTLALTVPRAVWDLRVEFSNGDVVFPVGGQVTIARSVTR